MNNKLLSVRRQVFLAKIIGGFAWIGSGISGFFRSNAGLIIQIVFLTLAMIVSSTMIFAKKENGDEMATENIMRAEAAATRVMHILFCAFAILTPIMAKLFEDITWSWPRVMSWTFFILLGIMDLIIGFIFMKLEDQ